MGGWVGLGCGHKGREVSKKTKTLFFNEATTKKVGMVKGTKSMYMMKYTCFCVHIFLQIFFSPFGSVERWGIIHASIYG
jgi:hypothetical protein